MEEKPRRHVAAGKNALNIDLIYINDRSFFYYSGCATVRGDYAAPGYR